MARRLRAWSWIVSESYTAFYTHALRAQLVALNDGELRTFLALASHCDQRGACFPSIRLLAAETGLTIDEIFSALDGLERKRLFSYLRRDSHDAVTHQQLPNVYALNPALIRVSAAIMPAENITEAIITKKPDRYYALPPIQNQNQEQESRTSSKKQPQRHTTVTKTNSSAVVQPPFEKGGDRVAGESSDYAKQGKNEGKDQRTARPDDTPETGEITGVRREPATLRAYAAPLGEDYREQRALELVQRCAGLSLPNARMLVDVYPATSINFALFLLADQKDGAVKNPARWFRKVIRRVDAQPESV